MWKLLVASYDMLGDNAVYGYFFRNQWHMDKMFLFYLVKMDLVPRNVVVTGNFHVS